MLTRHKYKVTLEHPTGYAQVHGPKLMEVTEEVDRFGHHCYIRAEGMGCSRNYPPKHAEAIRTFAGEHGARVTEIKKV